MSGILDVFYFIFESDAKKLDDGLKKSDDANKKLETSLLKTDAVATALGDNFIGLAKKFAAIGAAAITLSALKSLVLVQAELTAEAGRTAQATRVNVEALSVYSRAVVNAGGDVGAFTETLKMLGERGRDPLQMLEQLQRRFQGLSQKNALRLGQMLGLDIGTINLLTKTKEELQAYIAHQRELGVITKEQVLISTSFNNQLRDTGTVFDDIRRRLSVVVLPALEKLLNIVERTAIWFRDNKEFTTGFFVAIATIITGLYLPAIATATAVTWAFLAPYLAIIAVVALVGAAFALAYDDVQAFLAGNESVTGELVKIWPGVGDAVKGFVAVMEWAKDSIANILKFIVTLITEGPRKAFSDLEKHAGESLNKLLARFPSFKNAISIVTDMIELAATRGSIVWEKWGIIIDKVWKTLKEAKGIFTGDNIPTQTAPDGAKPIPTQTTPDGAKPIPKNIAKIPEATAEAVNLAKAQLSVTAASPLLTTSSTAISNMRNNSKSISIKVDNVTIDAKGEDAQGIAGNFAEYLQQQMTDAINHHDDGLAA